MNFWLTAAFRVMRVSLLPCSSANLCTQWYRQRDRHLCSSQIAWQRSATIRHSTKVECTGGTLAVRHY